MLATLDFYIIVILIDCWIDSILLLLFLLQEPLFVSVQQGDLNLLMQLLSKNPNGISACDEVTVHLFDNYIMHVSYYELDWPNHTTFGLCSWTSRYSDSFAKSTRL